jgi:hypothetical protein
MQEIIQISSDKQNGLYGIQKQGEQDVRKTNDQILL